MRAPPTRLPSLRLTLCLCSVGQVVCRVRFAVAPLRNAQQMLSGVLSEHGITAGSSVVVGPDRCVACVACCAASR